MTVALEGRTRAPAPRRGPGVCAPPRPRRLELVEARDRCRPLDRKKLDALWNLALDAADNAIGAVERSGGLLPSELDLRRRELLRERRETAELLARLVADRVVRSSPSLELQMEGEPTLSNAVQASAPLFHDQQKPAARVLPLPDGACPAVAQTQTEMNGETEPILIAERVRKVYRSGGDEIVALHGLDLVVPHGEFLAVMGPSGSGKTTLLNCVSGLDEIDGGRVLVDGLSIHELSDKDRTRHRAQEMGFIFQAFNLIPVFTTTENVELPLLLAGAREREARARARETLTRVGLAHRLDRRPPELSGGEQQRVAVARALAGRPRIVWADEPTGNLDSEMAQNVIDLLGELHEEGLTLILITHDPTVAAHADRLITIRDGRLVADERLGTAAPTLVGAG
jgi:putative ABC transport system ATP-binding protein